MESWTLLVLFGPVAHCAAPFQVGASVSRLGCCSGAVAFVAGLGLSLAGVWIGLGGSGDAGVPGTGLQLQGTLLLVTVTDRMQDVLPGVEAFATGAALCPSANTAAHTHTWVE